MKSICFVCLGNICRSPMAEFVMKSLSDDHSIRVASRGTSSWEHGNPIHQGTQQVLREHGLPFDRQKTSQQIRQEDFASFDYIIGMDQSNVEDLHQMAGPQYQEKIFAFDQEGVPDPWYTGDFQATYRQIQAGCRHWRETLMKEKSDERE